MTAHVTGSGWVPGPPAAPAPYDCQTRATGAESDANALRLKLEAAERALAAERGTCAQTRRGEKT